MIRDRTIVLTGATGGIGAAIASTLASHGARLVLLARDGAALQSLANRLPAASRAHVTVVADIASDAGREAITHQVSALGERMFGLIHAAGVSQFCLFADASAADLEAQMAINATGPILLTRALLPMLDPEGARIVAIGSTFGGIGYPGFAAYCASKFALRGFVEALRRELADSAIQVAYLAPRATRTAINSQQVCEMNAALGNAMDPPERVAGLVEKMLLARTMKDAAIGWPERGFLRLNALIPALVDGALKRQLGVIRRYATAAPH